MIKNKYKCMYCGIEFNSSTRSCPACGRNEIEKYMEKTSSPPLPPLVLPRFYKWRKKTKKYISRNMGYIITIILVLIFIIYVILLAFPTQFR